MAWTQQELPPEKLFFLLDFLMNRFELLLIWSEFYKFFQIQVQNFDKSPKNFLKIWPLFLLIISQLAQLNTKINSTRKQKYRIFVQK